MPEQIRESRSRTARRHRLRPDEADFRKYFYGESITDLFAEVTQLAVPLIAIRTFQATPFQVGLTSGAGTLPLLMVTPFVGVLVDRSRLRPLMMRANGGRTILLITLSLIAWLLTPPIGLWTFILVTFLLGTLATVYNIASMAFVPTVVDRDRLPTANMLLSVSQSFAGTAGPAFAGVLIQVLTAAGAIPLDAAGMLLGVLLLALIRRPSAEPALRNLTGRAVLSEIRLGMSKMFGDRTMAVLALSSGWVNFFEQVLLANFLLFAARTLNLSAGVIGLLLAASGIGALAGGVAAARLPNRLRLGQALSVGKALTSFGPILLVVVSHRSVTGLTLMAIGFSVLGAGLSFYNVLVVSLRQQLVSPALMGRVGASFRVVAQGTVPLGALLGGTLGGLIGFRAAIAVAVGALILGCVVFWFTSPARLSAPPAEPTIT